MSVPRQRASSKDAWKVRSLRSTFGPQCLASQSTAPASSFGSSLRESASKTYVSPAVDKARVKGQGGNNSPGPIYRQTPAIGAQPLSTIPSAPALGFPWSKRRDMSVKGPAPGPGAYNLKTSIGCNNATFESTKAMMPSTPFGYALRDAQQLIFISKEHDKFSTGIDSPGPSTYNVGRSVGSTSRLSTEKSAQAVKMGSNPRFQGLASPQAASIPGPGHYALASPVITSQHAALPRVGFAKANRDANKKIFISLEHEKASYGELSPGPGTANPRPSVGRQLVSRARSAPTWSFGSSRRSPLVGADGPGPGEYYA